MLNKISTSFLNSKQYVLSHLARKTLTSSATGLCCIGVAPQAFTLVYASQIQGKETIELCESHPYKDKNSFIAALSALVKNNQLKNVDCSLMLQAEDYQLLVTDALPVTAAEFQAAIRWKIKDLIRFPLDDVVIDSFPMPKMKTNQDKIMVIAAQASKLKILCDQIHDCGLNVKFIDIPELGLRNILFLYEQKDQTIGLLYVQENSTQLLITSNQQIYVSRQLKFSLNIETEDSISQGIERLASEIQRSLDYYQSLWDHPLPSAFIFASTKLIGSDAVQLLSKRIRTPVQIINMKDTVIVKPTIDFSIQNNYLAIVGGALRKSVNHATAD